MKAAIGSAIAGSVRGRVAAGNVCRMSKAELATPQRRTEREAIGSAIAEYGDAAAEDRTL
jgi:hypothetical protein